MRLHQISIRRHVLAYMMSAVIVLFGIVGYQRVGLDRHPNIEFPMVSVTTTLPGADPEIVDASVTNLIETAVNSTPGIEHIVSSSSPGVSLVAINFSLTKDVDTAFNEVQVKVNQVLRDLPKEADPPVVAKVEFGAAPILWLSLQGDRTLQQLNQYARNVIKKRLENIAGVGEVRLGGRRDRTIRVQLLPDRLAAHQLTVQDLLRAFAAEHLQLPGGQLTSRQNELLVKLDLEFHATRDLENLIVAYREGAPILLSQVARVEDGLADLREMATYNGQPAVSLGVVKISGANSVAIVERVKERLNQEILPQLPPGLTLSIAYDDSDLILRIVHSLQEHLLLGTLMAALVVWLFLRSVRSTLIVAVAIPVSLMGAVVVLYFSGFTFNVMTLLGLLLLVGVVVDDAIVVLENIFRHREEGLEPDPVQAAEKGTGQVVFAVLAATLTLVSIFAPVMFLGGIIGRFFRSFAMVVTFGVLTSLFVSLTLTPMLCSRYLVVARQHGRVFHALEKFFIGMDDSYRSLLNLILRFRWLTVAATVAVVLGTGPFFAGIGKGFMPLEDEGRFLISFKTPTGSSLAYTEGRLGEIEAVLARHPEVMSVLSSIGSGAKGQVSQGSITVRLKPQAERNKHQYALMAELRQELAEIPGVQAFAAPVPTVGGQRGEPLQFAVVGPVLGEVARLAKILHERFNQIPELGSVDLDLLLDLPQLRLQVERSIAAGLGVASRDVAQTVQVAVGGLDVAKYNDDPGDGERYRVRLQAAPGALTTVEELQKLYVKSAGGEPVRLDTVAKVTPVLGAAAIPRVDLQYAANFYSTPTVPEGVAAAKVVELAAGVLPLGYQLKLLGRAEEFGKTVGYVQFTLVMALVLIYMVLASQFNSFLQPLIIMVAQPLAIVGGIFSLWLFNHSLNIYSMIGLVLLMGLVAKNSILLVDLANQLRREGWGIDAALREACPVRMRPVVMTSLTIILAMLPAGMGLGEGADTNAPLAVVIIGGMVSSTLLTLAVVPAVYSLVMHGVERVSRWLRRPVAGEAG